MLTLVDPGSMRQRVLFRFFGPLSLEGKMPARELLCSFALSSSIPKSFRSSFRARFPAALLFLPPPTLGIGLSFFLHRSPSFNFLNTYQSTYLFSSILPPDAPVWSLAGDPGISFFSRAAGGTSVFFTFIFLRPSAVSRWEVAEGP